MQRVARTGSDWSVRAALAGLTLVFAYFSLSNTLAQAVRRGNTALAHRLAPNDGRIAAQLALKILEGRRDRVGIAQASDIARHALRQDATAVASIPVLGADAEMAGNKAGARRLLAYGQHLSRRDLGTHLWAIEEAVSRNDLDAALLHYDLALRTSRPATEILFPVLAAAVEDEAVRASLRRTLAQRPVWGNLFLEYAAQKSAHPGALADLFRQLAQSGYPVPPLSRNLLIATLLDRGLVDVAWSYYTSVRPGVDRNSSRDSRFALQDTLPTRLDWTAEGTSGVSVDLGIKDSLGGADISSASSAEGAALQQMQVLRPGRYRLVGEVEGLTQDDNARPYWTLLCKSGAELGRVEMPASNAGREGFSHIFDVPVGCDIQTLALIMRPSAALSGVSGRIVVVRLQRAP